MRISGIEPSSVILSQKKKKIKRLNRDSQTKFERKGMVL